MNRMFFLFLFALGGSLFAGSPTVAPTGNELYLTMGPPNKANLVSTGGRFDGRLGASSVDDDNLLLNLWCLDAQLSLHGDTPYRVNSSGFERINSESATGGSRDVRYEEALAPNGVENDSIPNLRHATGFDPGGHHPREHALSRYRMAAHLLDQYTSSTTDNDDQDTVFVSGEGQFEIGKNTPTNSAHNHAIIGAIWPAMHTHTDPDDQAIPSGSTLTWLNRAATYVHTNRSHDSISSEWAVVSGWSGTSYVHNSGSPVQALLTETPEPSFYGLLCTGLSALVLAASRRKKN